MEEHDATLLRAALASADLTQPVRFFSGETGGFVLQTTKGENTPARISEQSVNEMTTYFEEILNKLDQEVALAEDEDKIPVDLLTAPPWFGPYQYMGTFYCLDDLSFQLDPNRSKTLLDPIFKVLVEPPADYNLTSPKIIRLKAVLNGECSQGLSCVYRMLYPEVQRAGPIALSPCVIAMLTHGVSIASVNRSSLVELLSAVVSALVPETSDDLSSHDASQFNSTHKTSPLTPDYCICCLLAKQTRSYVDASNEVAYSENRKGLLNATTFIGVMKTDMGEQGSRKREVDYFAPVINIDDSERCYLADKSPFSDYRLEKRLAENDEPLWVVLRNAPHVPQPNKINTVIGLHEEHI